ncbi:peptidoglycan-associated lipoprotein Pal [Candidatus Pelagibacter sp. HIMB1695]|uniref:peptidoglycan-associated lipoprotein Pal n=1 Tax=Candidatus Pelagibacter sp. HIMB1695 TaxID=3413364 RepID=UPI003F84A390
MRLNKILKNALLVISAGIILTACATKKEVAVEAPKKEETKKEETKIEKEEVTKIEKIAGQMQGDVYVGTDSVKYLADGVADRVFFATNESILTTASRETLRAQAAWLRENSNITVVLEGHADERGTREYNLALGERRANAAKDYLMTYGVSSDRITVISYGKERPVDSGSNPLAWSKNRRSVTVKAN